MTAMSQAICNGERAILWIEKLCLYPTGPERGQHVCLSLAQKEMIRRIYDGPGDISAPVTGPLAAYLALYHICGPAALHRDAWCPQCNVDIFTLWNAAGPDLRKVLKRDGDAVVCPELGTRYAA